MARKPQACVKGHPEDEGSCVVCAALARDTGLTKEEHHTYLMRQHGWLHEGLVKLHRECVKAMMPKTASWYSVKSTTAEVTRRRDALNALLEYELHQAHKRTMVQAKSDPTSMNREPPRTTRSA